MAFSFLMSLTEEEFKTYLKTSIKEALLENHPTSTPAENHPDFLTIKQASEFTHIPVATLYDYTHKKRIPYNKVGKKLLFKREELIEWIANHRTTPKLDLDRMAENHMLKLGRRK